MLDVVEEVTTFTLAFKCGKRVSKRKQPEAEPAADRVEAAAGKLVPVLKTYRKNRGLEREELHALARPSVISARSSSGHRPKPTVYHCRCDSTPGRNVARAVLLSPAKSTRLSTKLAAGSTLIGLPRAHQGGKLTSRRL